MEIRGNGQANGVIVGGDVAGIHGKGFNKPIGRPTVKFSRNRAIELREAGMSWRDIGKDLGVGATTIRRTGAEAGGEK